MVGRSLGRSASRRLRAVIALSCAALAPLLAQTPTPSGQRPVFRAESNLVAREVVVRDAAGRFVPDLTRPDFQAFEDGVEQPIEWFTLVRDGQVVMDAPAPPAASAEGLLLPPSAPPVLPARIWIVLVDDLHLQATDTPRVRAILRQIGEDIIQDEDLVAVVSTGYSSIATDLSYDIGGRRLVALTSRVMGSGLTPAALINMRSGANGLAEVKYQAHVAFSTVHDLLLQARAIPNRSKAILYVSSGYDFNPLADSRLQAEQERWSVPSRDGSGGQTSLANPFDRGGSQFSDAELVAELAELIRAANRANVRFHTIDPRGLDAGPPIDGNISPVEWRRLATTQHSSLRVLAEQSGGIAVVNTNDFSGPFRRIADGMDNYYVIGYTSRNTDPSRRTRLVEIRAPRRPELTLKYEGRYSVGR